MELILVAKDSMPIYFQSKNKQLDDINVAAFISAVKSFAKGSLQSDLVSLKLGDMDIRLKENDGLMYVLGMSVNTELMPSEVHISKLVHELSHLTTNWISTNHSNVLDLATVPTDSFSELIVNFEKEILKEAENEHKLTNGSGKIVSSTVKDWNLLTIKNQELLGNLLESIIIGDQITIIDNNPNAPIIKDLCMYFRLSKDVLPNLQQYHFDVDIKTNVTEGILFDAENNKITGKVEKNKYLIKYVDKILHQNSVEHQERLVNLLTSTIANVCKSIINSEVNYSTEQGKILNLLNNLEFEEVRLVLQILKRNKPTLHEKIIKLPIHKEWFNSW